MQAVRQFVRVENQTLTVRLPESFSASHVEVIVLPSEERPTDLTNVSARRRPSARIAGKGAILGDIMEPVVPDGDWNALK